MSEQALPAVVGRLEPTVRQHHGGEPMFTMNVIFGTVELQERPVFDGNRMGYECRKVTKDRSGVVTEVGPWNPPLCWLVLPEPEPARPWWARLFGAA